MPRQPFFRTYPTADYTLTQSSSALEDRPWAAILMARCVAAWTDAELQLAYLLANLMQINTEAAVAIYFALPNSRAKATILNTGAEFCLKEDSPERELYNVIMDMRESAESQRNALAHGHLGTSLDVPDSILWIASKDYLRFLIDSKMAWPKFADDTNFRKKIYFYTSDDLQDIELEISDFEEAVQQFNWYFSWPHGPQRDELYQKLCALPRVSKALSPLRMDRKRID